MCNSAAVVIQRTASALQEGCFLSGRPVDPPPRFFLGAVENPTAPPLAYRADGVLVYRPAHR